MDLILRRLKVVLLSRAFHLQMDQKRVHCSLGVAPDQLVHKKRIRKMKKLGLKLTKILQAFITLEIDYSKYLKK